MDNKSVIFMLAKSQGGELLAKNKMGRPTNSPKTLRVTARVDEKVYNILYEYCEKNNISIAEGVRQAIIKLNDHKK